MTAVLGPPGRRPWLLNEQFYALHGDMSAEQNLALKSDAFITRFWLRVGDLCARSRVANGWVGTDELRKWNKENSTPCGRCLLSKDRKACTIVDDHPSCLTCRTKKLSCDRRARFVFEHTKDEFFDNFEEFSAAFALTPSKDVQEIKRTKSRTRRSAIEALTGSNGLSVVSGDFEKGKKNVKKKTPDDGTQLHTLLSSPELQDITQCLRSTRTQILSLRCELEDKLASIGGPKSTIEQLLHYTHYYESALLDHRRYL
ncbi:hypothetical protein C8F04DRAFT_1181901 [Mycena alexandri]|uniref:Uncharacterized protein n=1 Tax=Mycena alexandri TaxID=1745969 RepID=A0AAD6SXH9_9AGAR|nr:hypothetical protein C8F04DRAFT_1181901 [Mycena alexandri]